MIMENIDCMMKRTFVRLTVKSAEGISHHYVHLSSLFSSQPTLRSIVCGEAHSIFFTTPSRSAGGLEKFDIWPMELDDMVS